MEFGLELRVPHPDPAVEVWEPLMESPWVVYKRADLTEVVKLKQAMEGANRRLVLRLTEVYEPA